MTPETKKRIEQIKHGEVPEGYKRTKVGIVPEEWDTVKLSYVLKKQTRKNTDGSIHNVLTNSATQGIISQREYFDKQIANDENIDGYYVVDNGYFVYNPRISVSAPCGPFNKYYGKEHGIMSPLYTVYKYVDKSPYYSEYLSCYFSSSNWYRYMNEIANYGARDDRMNVTSDDMNAMPLPYPPLVEQEKIAEILATQDKIIELYQKKTEELKKLKKAYLSKMFPEKGSNVPELRFKGFTDPWEQRKLGEISTSYSGGTPTAGKNEYYGGVIPFIRSGEIYSDKTELLITELGYNNSSAAMVNKGDILYALYGATSGEVGRSKINGAINQAILAIIPDAEYDADYLTQWLTKEKDNIINTYLQGGQGNLSGTIVKALKVDVTSLEEQQQIGLFFANIDNLITLHQRKVEELQNEKKALMQLLLTGIVRVK